MVKNVKNLDILNFDEMAVQEELFKDEEEVRVTLADKHFRYIPYHSLHISNCMFRMERMERTKRTRETRKIVT